MFISTGNLHVGEIRHGHTGSRTYKKAVQDFWDSPMSWVVSKLGMRTPLGRASCVSLRFVMRHRKFDEGERMRYRDHFESRRDDRMNAEFDFLMDEYASRLGCAPPVRLLGQLPGIMANALLTRAILLKKPIDEVVGHFPEAQRIGVLGLVAGAGAPERLRDLGAVREIGGDLVQYG